MSDHFQFEGRKFSDSNWKLVSDNFRLMSDNFQPLDWKLSDSV